ncbi:MAG TPA: hypothetical protein V6C65_18145, partial [Allocoleopsis sp.]
MTLLAMTFGDQFWRSLLAVTSGYDLVTMNRQSSAPGRLTQQINQTDQSIVPEQLRAISQVGTRNAAISTARIWTAGL